MEGVKYCRRCDSTKMQSEFSKDKARPDGLQSWCKSCKASYYKAYYAANADTLIQRSKDWRECNLERAKEKDRNWRLQNPHKAKAKDKRNYEKNKDRVNQKTRRWFARNKERAKYLHRTWWERNKLAKLAINARRRARLKEVTVGFVDYSWLLEIHGMVCHICGGAVESREDLHFDHVIPLARGGEHSNENIRPAHALCNRKKWAHIIPELCTPIIVQEETDFGIAA